MKKSLSVRVIVPEKVLLREVADEAVILNLNTERYYGLDRVGTRFWIALTTSATIQEAIDTLLSEYAVDRATLEQDMHALLDKLIAQGLIELRDE